MYLVLGGGHKFTKIGLAMGTTIGGNAAKSGKKNHFLVVRCLRLLQKIVLLDLTNRTRLKKGNGYKICTESVRYNWGMRVMINTPSIYYLHTNVDLLGVYPP